MADGFARTYNAELLFDETPTVNKTDLLTAMRRRCVAVEPVDGNGDSGLLSFVYPDHPVTYADASVPAQMLMTIAPTAPSAESLESSLQQSWDWPDARGTVARCRSKILVTDFMSSGLEYKERLALFQNAVSAVLDIVSCQGIHWLPSQRVVSPAAYATSKHSTTFDPLFPALNIRLFRITNAGDQETLMDTMGLAALGIPDLQCHFLGLDVNSVAKMLYNTAYYVFENGDVIRDGETIQGIAPEDRWRCQHEDALVGPERVVLDINPGAPHAAGGRS